MHQNGTAPPPLAVAVVVRTERNVTTYTLHDSEVTVDARIIWPGGGERPPTELPQFTCTGVVTQIAVDPLPLALTHWQRVRLALGALWREVRG
jgi:hypothetical protein